MNIAYTCVLIAIFLPYVWAMSAKSFLFKRKSYDNNNPRLQMEKLEGWHQRANWAQQNAFEALPGFIAGVIIASIAGVAQNTIDLFAVIFILCRFAHGISYIKDWANMRSFTWGVGIICVIGLFVSTW